MRILPLALAVSLLVAHDAAATQRRRAASVDPCSIRLAPASITLPAGGGQAIVQVTASGPANCSWSPVSEAGWLSASPASGGITVSAGPNSTGASRTGLVHVRSSVVVVTQDFSLPNLLTNGSFAKDLANWSTTYSTGAGAATWASEPPSLLTTPPLNLGVAAITSMQASTGYQLNQCVAVSPNTTYDAGVSIFMTAAQSHGFTVFALYPYDNPTCQGNYLASRQDTRDTPLDTWFDDKMSITTDGRTRGMLVVLGAGGAAVPPFTAYFDAAFIRPR